MSNSNSSSSSGIGFTGLLTVAFIVLKLCGVINWSWWWVLAPAWIPFSLLIIGFGVYVIYQWRKGIDTKKRLASGMNEWAWRRRKKNKSIDEPTVIDVQPKSRWQQRMEEMQKKTP